MMFSECKGTARSALATALVMLALATGTPARAIAQSSQSASPNGLSGTWVVEVTLRNCDTQAPLGAPFQSLVTFHQGGTITESSGALGFAPNQRSNGHGTWNHEGVAVYTQRMIALILFDTPPQPPVSPGFFRGWQTIVQTIRLEKNDQFTSVGANRFFRADGTTYRTGCSTAVGHRF